MKYFLMIILFLSASNVFAESLIEKSKEKNGIIETISDCSNEIQLDLMRRGVDSLYRAVRTKIINNFMALFHEEGLSLSEMDIHFQISTTENDEDFFTNISDITINRNDKTWVYQVSKEYDDDDYEFYFEYNYSKDPKDRQFKYNSNVLTSSFEYKDEKQFNKLGDYEGLKCILGVRSGTKHLGFRNKNSEQFVLKMDLGRWRYIEMEQLIPPAEKN